MRITITIITIVDIISEIENTYYLTIKCLPPTQTLKILY